MWSIDIISLCVEHRIIIYVHLIVVLLQISALEHVHLVVSEHEAQ